MNESANQRTLGQIAFDHLYKNRGTWIEWGKLTDKVRTEWDAAVEAAVLARQHQTSPVGELSEKDTADLLQMANDEFSRRQHNAITSYNEDAMICFKLLLKETSKRLTSRPTTLPYFVTAQRPPTEADANTTGYVLAWLAPRALEHSRWTSLHWKGVTVEAGYHFWMPQPLAPVPPVSAEEVAWKAHCAEGCVASRASWDAAKAFFNREDASK